MAIQAKFYSENIGFALGNNTQELFMDNNNFYCVPQQHQQQQQYFMQFDHHQFQNSKKDCFLQENNISQINLPKCNVTNDEHSIAFSQCISEHTEKQKMEIDGFISLQNERLRLALQEQKRQQMSLFLKKHEAKIQFLLKQKEQEIAMAANRTMELEHFLKRMEIENQTWQRLAKENESIVASLNSTIERLRESACLMENAVDDTESCCENRKEEEEKKRRMVCKCCNARDSCVIMLPCRHLCSCKNCEAFLDFCPVCRVVKKGSIEALV